MMKLVTMFVKQREKVPTQTAKRFAGHDIPYNLQPWI